MTPHEILKESQSILKTDHLFIDNILTYLVVVFVAGMLIISSIYIVTRLGRDEKQIERLSGLVTVVLIVGTAVFGLWLTGQFDKQYKAEQVAYVDWVEDSLFDTIQTAEHTDRELVLIEDEYPDRPDIQPVVKFKNDQGMTETLVVPKDYDIRYGLRYDVDPGDAEFVRFYQLGDIGHGFEPGEYGLTVHLHKKEVLK